MPAQITVRDATVNDAEGIAHVHVDTWRAAYRGIVPDDYLDALDVDDRAERWRGGIAAPDGPIWVADNGGTVVGWACVGPTRDDDLPGSGELYGIYVDPSWWGKDVGPRLMKETLDWLRPRFDVAALWTLDANARARRFYERYGWRVDGTTKDDDRESFVLREVRYRIEFR
jgi:GNAT superfamily N-acetyltransferase